MNTPTSLSKPLVFASRSRRLAGRSPFMWLALALVSVLILSWRQLPGWRPRRPMTL